LRPGTLTARRLRRDATDVERPLWRALRERCPDWKFRRQHPIGRRIADFACPARKLAIELDGSQHAERIDADALRTAEIERYGYRVIRFWNSDVLENIEGVLETVLHALEHPTSPATRSIASRSDPSGADRRAVGRVAPLRPEGAERGNERGCVNEGHQGRFFGPASMTHRARLHDPGRL
jgi:very-short-patch-repair endonuclease